MNRFWKKVAALCVAAAAIAASVALATAATGGSGGNGSNGKLPPKVVFKAALPAGPDQHLSALAKELGVSTGDLRDALDSVREKLAPPKPPNGPPSRAELEKRCNEFTDALAAKLGKSGDEVRSASKTVMKAEIEDAVKGKKLTREQADKMLDRLDDAACLPVFGPGVAVHCGPPPGAQRGSGSRDSVLPAPPPDGPALEFGPAA